MCDSLIIIHEKFESPKQYTCNGYIMFYAWHHKPEQQHLHADQVYT